ncbi:MAG TPA: carboxypeptidase-like regulatory domain-containing protein [Terracidiphilus sp.]
MCEFLQILAERKLRRMLAGCAMLMAFALGSIHVHAQATQGSIIGTVKDPNGSVVAAAGVTLTNTDEGIQRTTRTSAVGDYQFLDVKAGNYQVEIMATGFQKWQAVGVTLTVRQELRLDAKLAVGAVQQEIQVTGDNVSAIQTESPTISATFSAADADSLPVNTRASFSGTSAAGILGTLPGVQDDDSGFSLQGALPYQLDVTVDGVTSKDATGGNFLRDSFPSTESISEIRADGVLANAEFGNPAQIVVTTKGGSNTLHGSGFFYYQDSAFNAIPYTYPTTTTKPSVTGKTFGASVGGPVVFPHLYNGHNKSFFFGAYEGWRHPAQETKFYVVPTPAMKQGDFSNYSSPGFTALRNPFTGTPYPNNQISGGISQIAANTLKQFYPDPNTGNTTAYVDDGTPNYQVNKDASGRSNQFDVRGDQYFGSNQKFLVWGKFTWKNFPINSPETLLVPSQQQSDQNRALKVDTNWSITPSLINEGGFGFTRFTSGDTNSFDGKAWTTAQGWQGLQNLFYNGIPEMDFNNIQSLNADRLTGLSKSLTNDYSDTLIWNKGRHTMKSASTSRLSRPSPPSASTAPTTTAHTSSTPPGASARSPVWTSPTSCSESPTPAFTTSCARTTTVSRLTTTSSPRMSGASIRSSPCPTVCAMNCIPATMTATATSATSIPRCRSRAA